MIYDIIFLSYLESNADKNWLELKRRFPRAKRVHGYQGIHHAHKEAAQVSDTLFFFIVDGDNRIKKDFHFECPVKEPQEDTLYVWRCHNPVNNLIYGYGAVKLYNKTLLQSQHNDSTDLATTISNHYHIVDVVASETHFYHKPQDAWRGAFRESAKLTITLIKNKDDQQAAYRLEQWLSNSVNTPNSIWVTKGAQDGHHYALQYQEKDISLINDFEWLNKRFEQESLRQKKELNKSQKELYRKIEQILLGLEILYPRHKILSRLRYFLEKYVSSDSQQALINDFFEVIKLTNHYPITAILCGIENTKDLKQYYALLNAGKYLYDDSFSETADSLKDDPSLWQMLRELVGMQDERAKVLKYLDLYIELYQDQNLTILKKAIKHLTSLNSDLPLWSYLHHVTKENIYHRIKVVRQNFPHFRIHESLSKNQVMSKVWLCEELQKITLNKPSLLITCGWSGLLPFIILDKMPKESLAKIRSVDIDHESTLVANSLNADAVKDHYFFKAATADAYELNYEAPQLTLINSQGKSDQETFHYDILINTSCEHLENFKLWYDKIPMGKLVILQSNNFFDCPEHFNCVTNIEQLMAMAPMSHYDFKGALEFKRYTRFMLIGQK